MRKDELSIAESPDGIMLDGSDEIENFYALIITTSKTTHAPRGESGQGTEEADEGAAARHPERPLHRRPHGPAP